MDVTLLLLNKLLPVATVFCFFFLALKPARGQVAAASRPQFSLQEQRAVGGGRGGVEVEGAE